MNYPLKEVAKFEIFEAGYIAATGVPDKTGPHGILITCPNCGQKACAPFENSGQRVTWKKTGSTLDDISLTPSFRMVGHFHSWIKNGSLMVDSPFTCIKP